MLRTTADAGAPSAADHARRAKDSQLGVACREPRGRAPAGSRAQAESSAATRPASYEQLNALSCVLMSHGVAGHAAPPAIDAALARVVAERMQMLASPSRVLILGRLKDGPTSVGALADAVGMEASAVSHQLRSLRHLGLVVGERRGKQVFYALHDAHVAELLDQAIFHVQHLTLGAAEPIDLPASGS
jgi:DNA-binding transcriptional ArsR family regulator